MNAIADPKYLLESNNVPVKGTVSTPEQLQILRIPNFFALTQAATKANGNSENYLSGWPLLTSVEIQLQKCSKCHRGFCSSINYKRHIRTHRRPFTYIKEHSIDRESLCAFWDKLSSDKAKDIISIKDVNVKDIFGSSVTRELSSLIHIMRFSSLPEKYMAAGRILLNAVTASSARFLDDENKAISSEELFGALDDASESTFMFAGTAQSVQNFIFDGQTQMTALEMKNIVATTSFMIELKLVEAWVADKTTEALTCQMLLLKEEEADRERQAEILKKKKLKKMRQKEQRSKNTANISTILVDENLKADSNNREEDHVQETEIMIGSISIPLENGRKFREFSCCDIEDTAEFSRQSLFSSAVAEAFLAQRWKSAMEADHVKLCLDNHEDIC